MPGYVDELKVKLSLEDHATPILKSKTDQFKKDVQEIETPLKNLLNLKNTLIIGALGGLAAFLLDASNKFAQLSRNVEQASLRFTDSEKNVRDLTFKLQEMANTSIYSTEQLAQGLGNIKTSGLEAAQALGLLQVAQAFSASTGMDLGKATEIENVLMETFNMTAAQSAETLLKIANASKSAGIDAEVLTKALMQLAPAAAAGGVSFDDLLATFSTLESNFKNPAASLEIMNTALQAIAGNGDALATIRQLGANLSIEQNKTTVAEVISNIVEEWGKLGVDEKIKKVGELQLIFAQKKEWYLVLAVKELNDLVKDGLVSVAAYNSQAANLSDVVSLPQVPIAPVKLGAGELIGKQVSDASSSVGDWFNNVVLGFQKDSVEGFGRLGYGVLRAGEKMGLHKIEDSVSKAYEASVKKQIDEMNKSSEAYTKYETDVAAYNKAFIEAMEKNGGTLKSLDAQGENLDAGWIKMIENLKNHDKAIIDLTNAARAAADSAKSSAASASSSASQASANSSTTKSGYYSGIR